MLSNNEIGEVMAPSVITSPIPTIRSPTAPFVPSVLFSFLRKTRYRYFSKNTSSFCNAFDSTWASSEDSSSRIPFTISS